MADNSARIAELEAILRSGVTTRTINGTTTTVDLTVIRQQLTSLRQQDDTQAIRKPRIASMNLSGLTGSSPHHGGCR